MTSIVDGHEKCLMLEDGCSNDVKRQKCDDTMDHEKLSYAAVVSGSDVVGGSDVVDGSDAQLKSEDWITQCNCVNALLYDVVKHNEEESRDCTDEDVKDVDIDTKSVLQSFDVFYDRAVILFFTGKLPLVSWIKQWLNTMLVPNCVEQVHVGPRGFFDVVFRSSEHRTALLAKVPLFFDRRLVHVMQWAPMVDYDVLLKQQCPVWVSVDCNHSFLWSLLPELMAKIGKVLVAPQPHSSNKRRFCMLWDTSCKRPGWVRMNVPGMRRLCFKLHWETYAGHCFKCGQLGHFVAECPSVASSVHNHVDQQEGIVAHQSNIALSMVNMVMDEAPSSEKVLLGQQQLSPSVDVRKELHNDASGSSEWHQVKRKGKEKVQDVQRDMPSNSKGNFAAYTNGSMKEGFKKGPWNKQMHKQNLPSHLKFDVTGRVLHNVPNNRGARNVRDRHAQFPPDEGGQDVVHDNPYAVLEKALSAIMHTVAHKEKEMISSKD